MDLDAYKAVNGVTNLHSKLVDEELLLHAEDPLCIAFKLPIA